MSSIELCAGTAHLPHETDLPWIKPSLDFEVLSASSQAEETHQRDERLVSAAKTGSTAAFSELFSLYSKSILKRTLSITGNMQDAEDAMQDTFLRAFVHLKQFDGRSKFYTWLTRVAINSSLMFLRKRRTRCETSFEFGSPSDDLCTLLEFEDTRPNPEEFHDQTQRYRLILRSIRRLRANFRAAVEMRIIAGRSEAETAASLGISVSAVKARMFRARLRLSSAQRDTCFLGGSTSPFTPKVNLTSNEEEK
jgi:RNA polymerase sigma-70 factor (ECF subfamily)